MNTPEIYRVQICGRTLESRNLKLLMARAVAEKRSMDRKFRVLLGVAHARPFETHPIAAAGR
jgi:hypothetical protein